MANAFEGKQEIELHGIKYEGTVNLRVIVEFTQRTGKDFHHVAINALNVWSKCEHEELMGLDRASELTKAIPMEYAAWLFYLAFKENNSQVQFEEIQEAVLMEGPLQVDGKESYPIKFIELVTFALMGVSDSASKKE